MPCLRMLHSVYSDWLIDWFFDCLTDWLINWLIDRLIDCLIDRLIDSYTKIHGNRSTNLKYDFGQLNAALRHCIKCHPGLSATLFAYRLLTKSPNLFIPMVNHSPPLPELCSTILFMLDSKILCRLSSSSGLLYSLPYSLFQDTHSSVYWNELTVAVSKDKSDRKLRRVLDTRNFMPLQFLALVYCWAKRSCDHVILNEYGYHAILVLWISLYIMSYV